MSSPLRGNQYLSPFRALIKPPALPVVMTYGEFFQGAPDFLFDVHPNRVTDWKKQPFSPGVGFYRQQKYVFLRP
jgi:hypothetical protein